MASYCKDFFNGILNLPRSCAGELAGEKEKNTLRNTTYVMNRMNSQSSSLYHVLILLDVANKPCHTGIQFDITENLLRRLFSGCPYKALFIQ